MKSTLNEPTKADNEKFRAEAALLIEIYQDLYKMDANCPKLPKIFVETKSKKGVVTYSVQELKLENGKPNRGHSLSVMSGYKLKLSRYQKNQFESVNYGL